MEVWGVAELLNPLLRPVIMLEEDRRSGWVFHLERGLRSARGWREGGGDISSGFGVEN